jgi:hypothetical protein
MKEVIESGKLKRFLDPRLSRAFGHRFREHLLAVFNERITSATEVGRDVGMEVPDFYKHITVLEELGCIEEVNLTRAYKKRQRGKHERFFRAKATILLDDRDWSRFPSSVKSDWMAMHIQAIWDDAVAAWREGAFRGGGPHVTWLPAVFDRRGWAEVMALLDEVLSRLIVIQRQSAERVALTGEPGIPATIAMMGFRTSHAKPAP